MEETNINQAAPQGENTGTVPLEQGKTKLFTQEEVNGFIQARLGQMKKQAGKEHEAEYNQKLQDLQAREMKILVKEALLERGMPKELAGVITCTDAEDLKSKLDAIQTIYGAKNSAANEQPTGFRMIGASNNGEMSMGDPVRKAMGLD